jgi:hypothetical protein
MNGSSPSREKPATVPFSNVIAAPTFPGEQNHPFGVRSKVTPLTGVKSSPSLLVSTMNFVTHSSLRNFRPWVMTPSTDITSPRSICIQGAAVSNPSALQACSESSFDRAFPTPTASPEATEE